MSTIINGFGALGVLLCIAMIALGILGRRVPVLGYVGVPLGVLVLGSLGTSAGAGGGACAGASAVPIGN